jgi:hypothetical protein
MLPCLPLDDLDDALETLGSNLARQGDLPDEQELVSDHLPPGGHLNRPRVDLLGRAAHKCGVDARFQRDVLELLQRHSVRGQCRRLLVLQLGSALQDLADLLLAIEPGEVFGIRHRVLRKSEVVGPRRRPS